MSGITVVVVPTWAIWIFVALGVLNIAQHLWKLWLLRKIEKRKTPNGKFQPPRPRGDSQ